MRQQGKVLVGILTTESIVPKRYVIRPDDGRDKL
jgi:hypothetical protein